MFRKNFKLYKQCMAGMLISMITWANLTGCTSYKDKGVETTYLETYFSDTDVSKSFIQHLEYQNMSEDGLVRVSELYCTAHSFNLVLEMEGAHLLGKEIDISVISDFAEKLSGASSVLISDRVIDENEQKRVVLVTGNSVDEWSDSLSLEIVIGDLTYDFTIPIEKFDKGKEFSVQTPFKADIYMDVNSMVLTSAGPQIDIHKITVDQDGEKVLYEKGQTPGNVMNYDELDNIFSFLFIFEEPIDINGIDSIFVN